MRAGPLEVAKVRSYALPKESPGQNPAGSPSLGKTDDVNDEKHTTASRKL